MWSLAQYFYNVKNRLSIITLKPGQRISAFLENWHFKSRFVLNTAKRALFVVITEILLRSFWHNNWRFVFDIVKILCHLINDHVNFRALKFHKNFIPCAKHMGLLLIVLGIYNFACELNNLSQDTVLFKNRRIHTF